MPSPISPKDLYAFAHVEDPQLSPDGARLAFVRVTLDETQNEYRRQIWLGDPTGASAPRPYSAGGKNDFAPRWSPDGTRLAFVSTRNGKPQLFVMEASGGEARALTSLPHGVSNPVWSPDGSRLAFFASVNADERAREDSGQAPTPPADALEAKHRTERAEEDDKRRHDPRVITRFPYRTGTQFIGDRRQHIYVLDVPTQPAATVGKPYRVTDGDYDYEYISWTPDGRSLLSTQSLTPEVNPWQHWAVVKINARGARQPHVVITPAGYDHYAPQIAPNGSLMAFLWRRDEGSFGRTVQLAVMPTRGRGKTRSLTLEFDRTVSTYQWSKDSRFVYFTAGDRGDVSVYRVSVTTANPRITKVVDGPRMVHSFSLDKRGNVAFAASTAKGPDEVFAVMDGQEKRLTQFNAALLKDRLVSAPEEFTYTSTDGYTLQGWLVKPVGYRKGQSYPLIVSVHGGPHIMWGPAVPEMWLEWQTQAAAGYAVFFCNPRGSEGYGEAHMDAIAGDWPTLATNDVLSGVDELVKRGIADPKKLVLTGGSYAGYLTAWILAHDQRFVCGWAQRGLYNLLSFYGTTDVPQLVEREYNLDYGYAALERLWKQSPLAHAHRIQTPLVIEHQENDYRCPVSEAEQLYWALRRLGRKVIFIRYPREGHEMSRSGEPRHRIDRLTRMLAWFDEHLSASAAPASPKHAPATQKAKAAPKRKGRPAKATAEATPEAPKRRGRPAKATVEATPEAPKRRGRPAKAAVEATPEAPKRRGRPAKATVEATTEAPKRRGRPAKATVEATTEAPKRRGRPAKAAVEATPEAPKRRGRPAKATVEATTEAPKRRGRPAKAPVHPVEPVEPVTAPEAPMFDTPAPEPEPTPVADTPEITPPTEAEVTPPADPGADTPADAA